MMEIRWMFLGFLLAAAFQDLHKRSVEIRLYILFALLFAVELGYRCAAGEAIVWTDLVCSLGVGAVLLACSVMWQGAVGLGDGYFFLVSGLTLKFWENLALLFYGVMLCGGYGLFFLVYSNVFRHKNVGKQAIPFLPFLVPAGFWIACRRSWGG